MFHYALPSDANLFYFKEADICRLRVRHIANNSPVLVRHIANNMPYRGAANSTNRKICLLKGESCFYPKLAVKYPKLS